MLKINPNVPAARKEAGSAELNPANSLCCEAVRPATAIPQERCNQLKKCRELRIVIQEFPYWNAQNKLVPFCDFRTLTRINGESVQD
jgi:hypothetical protein